MYKIPMYLIFSFNFDFLLIFITRAHYVYNTTLNAIFYSKVKLTNQVRSAWPIFNLKSGRGLSRKALEKLYYTALLVLVTR